MSFKDCRKLKIWMLGLRKILYDIVFEDIFNVNFFCFSVCFLNKDLVFGSSYLLGEKRLLLFNVRSMFVLVWFKYEIIKKGELKIEK